MMISSKQNDVTNTPNYCNVVVHTMGKTGSTSIDVALANTPNIVPFKSHVIDPSCLKNSISEHQRQGLDIPYHLIQGKEVYERFIAGDEPAKFIIPFRNPVLRNFSAFFQTFKLRVGQDLEEFNNNMDAILQEFADKFPFNEPVWWVNTQLLSFFTIELKYFTAVREYGFSIVSCDNSSLMLIRMDLPNFEPVDEISAFIGCRLKPIGHHNITDKTTYQNFLRKVKVPKAKMDKLFNNKFLREIMQPEEIQSCYDKYVI